LIVIGNTNALFIRDAPISKEEKDGICEANESR
jgi:hypothetical protein